MAHLLRIEQKKMLYESNIRYTMTSTNFTDANRGDVIALCKQGRLKEALHILYAMNHRGFRPDVYVYDSLLQGCLNAKALPEGKLVHAHIIQTGFKPDIVLGTKLITMYGKCGSLADAHQVLGQMPERNVVSWTAMISAYAKHGCGEEALKLFYQMQRTGVQPNQYTFASVLPACGSLAALERGKDVHEDIIRGGFMSNAFVGNALVNMYVKCGSLEDARQVFDKMPKRSAVPWSVMIAGYTQNRCFDEALKLFQQMQLIGVKPNSVTFASVLPACANSGSLEDGKRIHEDIVRSGFESNVIVGSALVDMYIKCGSIDDARQVFDKMPERNVVSWTALIAGYVQNGHFDEALRFFGQMQLTGVKPDLDTFTSVLPAYANVAALQRGKEIHQYIIRSGYQSDVFVSSALVDMYAKCGSIENARQLFDRMPMRDVVSWTAMIIGYAMHGCGEEALKLFEQMQNSGIKPNRVTFVGVLFACCHAGLVDDAWQNFDSMSRDYHMAPAVEHYCCMVDLLGRAGCLKEAEDFISNMPIKPDVAVWGTLLSACRIHTNIEIGERVAKHLFEVDPENSAHYVLLSNIYAAAGRWEDIEKVRRMMKNRKVKKMPGRSWIEINNKVHAFVGGDKSHPEMPEIHAKLEQLSGLMKETGYVPDMNFALHDVEVEQKEHALCHHSEKLAIAFGLINTSPGTPIRIVKNLRMCGDCHSAIKFITKIVVREIVVRDASRFHHFRNGHCSCEEYW